MAALARKPTYADFGGWVWPIVLRKPTYADFGSWVWPIVLRKPTYADFGGWVWPIVLRKPTYAGLPIMAVEPGVQGRRAIASRRAASEPP